MLFYVFDEICVDYATADPFRKLAENRLLVVDYPEIKTREYEDFKLQVVREFSNEKFSGLPRVTSAEKVSTIFWSCQL
jgi:hypothetical protein